MKFVVLSYRDTACRSSSLTGSSSTLPGSLEAPIPFCPPLPLHLVRERPDVILDEGGSNLLNNLAVFDYARLTRTRVVW